MSPPTHAPEGIYFEGPFPSCCPRSREECMSDILTFSHKFKLQLQLVLFK